MKKIAYIITLLALTACSNDDVVQTSSNDEIKLSVVTNTASRAISVFDSNTKPSSAYLWAYTVHKSSDNTTADGIAYIDNQKIVPNTATDASANSWVFADSKHYIWPTYDNLNFFAYRNGDAAPTGLKYLSVTDNKLTLPNGEDYNASFYFGANCKNVMLTGDIVLDEDAADGNDILYSAALGQTNSESNTAVSLTLKHALALLEFQFVNNTTNYKMDVQSIAVTNVYAQGNFFFSSNGTAPACVWTEKSVERQNETFTAASTRKCNFTDNNLVIYPKADDDTEAVISYPNDVNPQMFVIPEVFSAGTKAQADDGSYVFLNKWIELKCRIYDDSECVFPEGAADGVYGTAHIAIPAIYNGEMPAIGWKAGYKYIYKIVIGNGEGQGIDDNGDPVLQVPMSLLFTIDDIYDTTTKTITPDPNL
jgi:hypothetical protein